MLVNQITSAIFYGIISLLITLKLPKYNLDMEKVKEYKHLIMLDLDKDDLDKISNGDDLVEEYEDKVTDLNNHETFRSFMAYEEGISQGVEQEKLLKEEK